MNTSTKDLKHELILHHSIEPQSDFSSKLIDRCLRVLHSNGYSNTRRATVADIVNKHLLHRNTKCNDSDLLTMLEETGKSVLEKRPSIHSTNFTNRLINLPNNFIHNLTEVFNSDKQKLLTYVITGGNILFNKNNYFERFFEEKHNILKSSIIKDKCISLIVKNDEIYQIYLIDFLTNNPSIYDLPKFGSCNLVVESFLSFVDSNGLVNYTISLYDELEKTRYYIKLQVNQENKLVSIKPTLKTSGGVDLSIDPEWIPINSSFTQNNPLGMYISKYIPNDDDTLEILTINKDVKQEIRVLLLSGKLGILSKVIEANFNKLSGLTHILGSDSKNGCFTMIVLDDNGRTFQFYPSITNNTEFSSHVQKIIGLSNSELTKDTISLTKLRNGELWLTSWNRFGIVKKLLIDDLTNNNHKYTPVKVSFYENGNDLNIRLLIQHEENIQRKNHLLSYKLNFDGKDWFTLERQ